MTPTLKYLWLTLKHKWFVLVVGLRIGAPLWRLVIHDWSKFTPSEAPHYGRQFFGSADDPEGFAAAWLHHQNSNPHHWEYWIPRTSHTRGGFENNAPLRMPDWAVREMVADWFAAGRAYEGKWVERWEDWSWWRANRKKVIANMHPTSVFEIHAAVNRYFGRYIQPEDFLGLDQHGEVHNAP